MGDSWTVTIFFEEDDATTSAHARLTGANPLGHIVGTGHVGHVEISPGDEPRELAMVRALADLTGRLDLVVGAHQTSAFVRV